MLKNQEMKISYSDALIRLRAKLDLSQKDLGDMLGVSFVTVNRWENEHFEPTKIVKQKLKDMFRVNKIDLENE